MIFYVLTLFPDMIGDAVNHSILKRAADAGLIEIRLADIRDFSSGKHRQADDAPYGGGAGMVMAPGPVYCACEHARRELGASVRIVYLTPQGRPYDQRKAEEFSKLDRLILLCGHYEGIDERALELAGVEEISLGDFVLTGGELAALAVIDSVSRLIPGVLGKSESFQSESFADGLLEYPQYTRPRVFNGIEVPPVLLSGHHKNIAVWRRRQSLMKTAAVRPDLLALAQLSKEDIKFLQETEAYMDNSRFLEYFEEISKIPRGSGNEKAISDWLYRFAKERGLDAIQDDVNNIIIKKPGTPGYENAATVILQAHMDMVCEKNADVSHDFLKDPIRVIREGDTVRADGTTLGADNGLAVAMILSLLDSRDIPHPPLEALLTADEESGMTGAEHLDGALLSGGKMINLDSGGEGVFIVSCAGGLRVVLSLPVEYTDMPLSHTMCVLRVKGLMGGHSGGDVTKRRGNGIRIMGRVLRAIGAEADIRLASISGGMKMNAIPREAEAVIAVNSEGYDKIAGIIKSCEGVLRDEYRVSDPSVALEFTRAETESRMVFTEEAGKKAVAILCLTPLGVQEMSQDMPDLPETSNNLGIVRTEGNTVTFSNALRSSVATRKYELKERIGQLAELTGAKCESGNDYPGWAYNPNSAMREALVAEFESMYGHKPVVQGIHAGLECGLFSRKLPGVDIISFGPDIFAMHSPGEHFSVSSAERVWEFLTRSLTKV